MKRILAATIALLLLSCDPPVGRVVVFTFNEPADLVTISATTTLGNAQEGTPEAKQIQEEREALLAGRDEWSMRFANADPDSDRIVLQRAKGQLRSLEHIASIAPENLQKFFFDTHLTVTFLRGEGWAELTIYPGSSERATRQQRERVDRMLALYSERAARYFQTVRGLYAYLDDKPQRAADMFATILRDDSDPPIPLAEKEEAIAKGVRQSIEVLMGDDEKTETLNRDFDAVFNPFPAELKVIIPTEALSSEGFTKMPDRMFVVKMPTAIEAVGMLEGRWITPDPVALVLASENKSTADVAAALADMPRRAQPVVTASDVANAMMEKMRPAPRYRLRWITRAAREPSPPPPRRPGSSEDEHTAARNRDAHRTPALLDSTDALRARWW